MCNRALLLFGKLPQRNLHVNCHVNGKTFRSRLRFQTGLSSLRVSCKRDLNVKPKVSSLLIILLLILLLLILCYYYINVNIYIITNNIITTYYHYVAIIINLNIILILSLY